MADINNQTLPKEAASPEPKRKSKRRIIILVIILLFLLGLYFLFRMFSSPKPNNYGDTINVNQTNNTTKVSDKIVVATSTEAAKSAKAIAWSENFDALQINLEGSGTDVFDLGETEIFTISNVASELYSTKAGDKNEIRAVISCQTNKRAYIEVEYLKSGEKNKKILKDTYLGFNHILVIPALDPDSVYKYSVSATDLNQTEVFSEQFVFYTGVGNISLVDVLGNAVQKVFG